jgi:hypothetical protein
VTEERKLYEQVKQRDQELLESITKSAQRNAATYRDRLNQVVLGKRGAVEIWQEGKLITPFEYKALPLAIPVHLIGGSEGWL